jgi:galactose oxidase
VSWNWLSSSRRCWRFLLLPVMLALGGWLMGPVRTSAGPDPAVVGQWSGVQAWPTIAIHAILLPTGKVLVWPRGQERRPGSDCRIWDPVSEQFVGTAPLARTNIFCAGHSWLQDGRLFVAGGHYEDDWGIRDINLYNPFMNTWTSGPSMNAGRWYPSCTTLPNGDVLIVSGGITPTQGINRLPQVWSLRTGSLRTLTGASRDVPYYPHMFVAPNGQVFMAGHNVTTYYLNTAGSGAWTRVAARQFDLRDSGASVLYDIGKVVTFGGHDPPTATAEAIDLNAAAPAWRYVSPMTVARRRHTPTLLPDGKVLVTGGTSGPGPNNESAAVLHAEMWDPATERFTRMASMSVPRVYHSTALLLPDGRVLSAGGGQGGGGIDRFNAEIYYPPYLFKGQRPTIAYAPPVVSYGQKFWIDTVDSASIRSAVWVRLGAVTHQVNMDQRIVRLGFNTLHYSLAVTAPTNRNLCPPGPYMLFILNESGVPSVARVMWIG